MIWLYPISWDAIGETLAPWVSSYPSLSTPSLEVFSYNGYWLHNTSILIVSAWGLLDSWAVDFWDSANNWTDWGQFIYRDWRKKTITLKGIVKATSWVLLEAKIDEMKWQLDTKNKILRYSSQGKYREINATTSNIIFEREARNITFCPFTITFIANDVYWRDSDSVAITTTWLTANTTVELTNSWNKETFPKFILYVNSWTTASFTITLEGITISYLGSLTAGDVLIIDSKTKTAYLNSVVVDYTGPCPIFTSWPNIVTFGFGAWTFNIDINCIFTKNFL